MDLWRKKRLGGQLADSQGHENIRCLALSSFAYSGRAATTKGLTSKRRNFGARKIFAAREEIKPRVVNSHMHPHGSSGDMNGQSLEGFFKKPFPVKKP